MMAELDKNVSIAYDLSALDFNGLTLYRIRAKQDLITQKEKFVAVAPKLLTIISRHGVKQR